MSAKIAWFSETQFNRIMCSKHNCDNKSSGRMLPYIYYYDKDDNIIQITEILSEDKKSTFDDAVCKGPIKKFYKCSVEPINDAN